MLGRAEINSHIKVSKEEMVCNCRRPDYHRYDRVPGGNPVSELLTQSARRQPSAAIRLEPYRSVSDQSWTFSCRSRAMLESRLS